MNAISTNDQALEDFLPLNDQVAERFISAWDKLENYSCQEKALELLFTEFPNNDDFSKVLIKCRVLNDFYSAGVRNIDLIPLAKHIVTIENIDMRLKNGDENLVAEIAECSGLRKYISFASKYCNWHNQKVFPIYDNYVVDVLCALMKKNILTSFENNEDIRQNTNIGDRYKVFNVALDELVCKCNLSKVLYSDNSVKKVNYKLLDRFVWLLGKYCFGSGVTVIDIALALGDALVTAIYNKYIITKAQNGSISVKRNGEIASNTKKALREISKQIGFAYDDKWNTRHFGQKLIEHINNK